METSSSASAFPRVFGLKDLGMRRVVRAASPELLWITDRELDDVFLQTRTRIWLGEVLHIRFDDETDIADLLADGELLFQVSKVIWKMLLKNHVDLKHSKIHMYERTSFGKSDGRYMPYPKVDSFLKICQILGLTGIDLFSPSDVVEKRDVRRVCMCIRSLSKKSRLKNLDVPDFDIVTYTIAMPTDLVGGIRRNLEQSQCSSSSSNGCSPNMDSREIHRQGNICGSHARYYDSFSESDEAESAFMECEFQSPLANFSYDAANLSHIVREKSLEANPAFDKRASELQTELHLDSRDQSEDGCMSPNLSVASNDSSHSRTTTNVNDFFGEVNHKRSIRSSCAEHRSDQAVSTCFADTRFIMWPRSNPETRSLINDIGYFQTRASASENSPFQLDEQLAVSAEEALKGCIGTMMRSRRLEDSLSQSQCMYYDSYRNLEYKNEGFMKPFEDPSGRSQEIKCTRGDSDNVTSECADLLDEISNEGSAFITEAHNEKCNCSSNTRSSEMAHDRPLEVFTMDTEGNEDNGNNSILRMHDRASVDNIPLSLNSNGLQADTSGLALHSIKDGSFVQSTRSLNTILDNASEDMVATNDCTAIGFLLSENRCLKGVEQCHIKYETSVSEIVASLAEEVTNTNLYDTKTKNYSALLESENNSSSVDTDATDWSSASETESHAICDLTLLKTDTTDRSSASKTESHVICDLTLLYDSICDTQEIHSCVETKNLEYILSFSSTASRKQITLGILDDLQIDRDCTDVSKVKNIVVDLNEIRTEGSNVCDGSGCVVTHNVLGAVNHVQSYDIDFSHDPVYDDCISRTNVRTHYEDSRQTPVILPCSRPACMVGREPCAQENIEEQRSMKQKEAEDTGKGEKCTDIEDFEVRRPTRCSSGRETEGEKGELHRPVKKVLKSIAGGITLVGALFFILHLKRGKEKNSRIVLPLQTHNSRKEQVEIGSTGGVYPTSRLKF